MVCFEVYCDGGCGGLMKGIGCDCCHNGCCAYYFGDLNGYGGGAN